MQLSLFLSLLWWGLPVAPTRPGAPPPQAWKHHGLSSLPPSSNSKQSRIRHPARPQEFPSPVPLGLHLLPDLSLYSRADPPRAQAALPLSPWPGSQDPCGHKHTVGTVQTESFQASVGEALFREGKGACSVNRETGLRFQVFSSSTHTRSPDPCAPCQRSLLAWTGCSTLVLPGSWETAGGTLPASPLPGTRNPFLD